MNPLTEADRQRRTAALAAVVAHLDWFMIPRTVDQIVGLYAESTSDLKGTTARARTNDEMVDGIKASAQTGRYGKGGHSDPTPQTALHGEPDAVDDDETLGMIDAALRDLEDSATALDHAVSDAIGRVRWHPPRRPGRQEQVATCVSRLHHCSPDLAAAYDLMDQHERADADGLLLVSLAESAAWLNEKGRSIWASTRGADRTVAVQQPILGCECCSPWRAGTIAGPSRLCNQCRDFRYHWKCKPNERIVRYWEATGKNSTPPGMILEAQAAAGRKVKAS